MKSAKDTHRVLKILTGDHVTRAKTFAENVRELVQIVHELDELPRHTDWSPDTIDELMRRQSSSCSYCGDPLGPFSTAKHHIDHRIPWSLGGGNELPNIQVLHKKCNLTKSAQYDDDELLAYLDDRIRNLRSPRLLLQKKR